MAKEEASQTETTPADDELLSVFVKARQRLYIQARSNEDYLFVDYCDSAIRKYSKQSPQ